MIIHDLRTSLGRLDLPTGADLQPNDRTRVVQRLSGFAAPELSTGNLCPAAGGRVPKSHDGNFGMVGIVAQQARRRRLDGKMPITRGGVLYGVEVPALRLGERFDQDPRDTLPNVVSDCRDALELVGVPEVEFDLVPQRAPPLRAFPRRNDEQSLAARLVYPDGHFRWSYLTLSFALAPHFQSRISGKSSPCSSM